MAVEKVVLGQIEPAFFDLIVYLGVVDDVFEVARSGFDWSLVTDLLTLLGKATMAAGVVPPSSDYGLVTVSEEVGSPRSGSYGDVDHSRELMRKILRVAADKLGSKALPVLCPLIEAKSWA